MYANTVNFEHTFHCELLITLAVELEGQVGQGLSHLVDSKIFLCFYTTQILEKEQICKHTHSHASNFWRCLLNQFSIAENRLELGRIAACALNC